MFKPNFHHQGVLNRKRGAVKNWNNPYVLQKISPNNEPPTNNNGTVKLEESKLSKKKSESMEKKY